MALTPLVRYVCDHDANHEVLTDGSMPAGWIQMSTSFNGQPMVFDTIDCASDWYNEHNPAGPAEAAVSNLGTGGVSFGDGDGSQDA